MKLLVFSDVHGSVAMLERLVSVEADLYFAAGDTVTWARGYDVIGPVLARRASRMHVLPGNHESEADVERLCRQYGLNPFHGRTLKLGEHTVAGMGYSNPTPFGTPGEYSEKELADRLSAFAGLQRLILICHCPPANTPLDRICAGLHAGSSSVREFIEREQPLWFFCGHIHEAEGVHQMIGSTRCVNVGVRGYVLDLPGEL